MKNLVKIFLIVASILSLSSPFIVNAETLCKKGVVQEISAGYVNSNFFQIRVTINNSQIFLNHNADLDSKSGSALLSLLLYSKSSSTEVALYDHNGSSCDDFDEVYLK